LCPNASWNPIGITHKINITTNIDLYNIFIDTNNNIYLTAQILTNAQFWLEGNSSQIIKNSILPTSRGLFVTTNGDIYMSNDVDGNIEIWTWNSTSRVIALVVLKTCSGIFIDINNRLYCSIESQHKVISTSLTDVLNIWTMVAGDGFSGYELNQLSFPSGIFLNGNSDLYVADCGNDRIQLFTIGQSNGITLIGNNTPTAILLKRPTGVVLDADNNLYIADQGNNRIVVFGINGLQCLFGCSDITGSLSSQLNLPQSLAFDSYGNMFVVDSGNNRIQKFMLSTNLCGKFS
jgi:hypothetical protein